MGGKRAFSLNSWVWILRAYQSAVPVQRGSELKGKGKRDERRGEKLCVMPPVLQSQDTVCW